jgi:hypothetical protein
MNLTLPTVDVSSAKADLADLGPRARSAITDLELPKVNLSHLQIPDLDHAGKTVTGALSDAGQAMSGALVDAGHLVSGALVAASGRLKDLRAVPVPEPKRRSMAPLAIGGVVIGAVALAVGTAVAVLLDPIQGARRRAAVRRRVAAVAEHMRQARASRASTPPLEASQSEGISPIEMGPGEAPDVVVDVEYSDEAVLVSAGASSSQNGSGHDSDAAVAEAGGE